MLREHPRLAVPPEAPWVVEVAPRRRRWTGRRQRRILEKILRHPRYRNWHLPEWKVRESVARQRPTGYAELITALFAAYAEREGKPRWGDKTPENVLHIGFLSQLFPRSVFVHVIRDGRDVAASLASQPWTSDGLLGKAYWWRDCVTAGRRSGRHLGRRYCELRLEDLIADPEHSLQDVCAAIGEDYSPQMLGYTDRRQVDVLTPEQLRSHPHLDKPPTAGLRDWRAGISADEQHAVTRVCGPLLRELGYQA
jgi:hypothetical protein